jgi:hypothetical protein
LALSSDDAPIKRRIRIDPMPPEYVVAPCSAFPNELVHGRFLATCQMKLLGYI